jgi:hypothetical protein
VALFAMIADKTWPSALPELPFPFDDPNARYMIEKRDNNKNYVVAVYYYNHPKPITYSYVAKSNVDLDEYLNKRVIVTGKWPRYIADSQSKNEMQCIQDRCHKIFDNSNIKVTPSNTIEVQNIITVD